MRSEPRPTCRRPGRPLPAPPWQGGNRPASSEFQQPRSRHRAATLTLLASRRRAMSKSLLAAASAVALALPAAPPPAPREAAAAAGAALRLAGLLRRASSTAISGSTRPSRSARAGTNMTASCPTGARPASPIQRLPALARSPPPKPSIARRLSTTEQRFERDYLIARARGDLFWLETADQPHRNPAYYMGRARPVGLRHPALCAGRDPAAGLHRLSARASRARRGRSAPICARRCR